MLAGSSILFPVHILAGGVDFRFSMGSYRVKGRTKKIKKKIAVVRLGREAGVHQKRDRETCVHQKRGRETCVHQKRDRETCLHQKRDRETCVHQKLDRETFVHQNRDIETYVNQRKWCIQNLSGIKVGVHQ